MHNKFHKVNAVTKISTAVTTTKKDNEINVKDMENKLKSLEKIDALKKVVDNAKNVYVKDNSKGDLLPEFLISLKKLDNELADIVKDIILKYEPAIFNKDSFMQGIVVTGILTSMLMTMAADISNKEANNRIVDMLSFIRYDYVPLVWIEVIKENFLPNMKEIRFYIIEYYKKYVKDSK